MKRAKLRRTPKVFGTSYRPTQSKSKRQLTGTTIKHWRPIVAVVGFVILTLLVARLPFFQIKTVTITGVTNSEIVSDLESLKGKSIFTNHINRMTTNWLGRDQSLSDLVCRRGIPDTVTCAGKNREGVLIWRQGGADYWVDSTGRVFAARQSTDPIALIVEDPVGEVKVGLDVASQEIVDTYIRLNQRLGERAITIKNFSVTDALYQPGVVVSAFTGQGGEVIQKELTVQFSATESIDAQVKTLTSLLWQRGQQIVNRIDLRVPGYVYYH